MVREGDPKPGQTLYLYTGMRTKACRKLGEVRCEHVDRIKLTRMRDIAIFGDGRDEDETVQDIAEKDGFPDHIAMFAWFEKTHGLPFEGLLIRWDPPEAAA